MQKAPYLLCLVEFPRCQLHLTDERHLTIEGKHIFPTQLHLFGWTVFKSMKFKRVILVKSMRKHTYIHETRVLSVDVYSQVGRTCEMHWWTETELPASYVCVWEYVLQILIMTVCKVKERLH